MKKTIAALFFILMVFSLSAAALSVGLEAGADWNGIIAGEGYRNYTYSNKPGFTVSVPVLVGLMPSLELETGLSYTMKNYGYSRTVEDDPAAVRTLDYSRYNHFIEVPVALRYTDTLGSSDVSLFASAGGFVGLWIYGSRSGYAYSISRNPGLIPFNEKTDLENYNICQAGVSASLGVRFKLSDRADSYIRAGYSLALTDLNRAQKYGSYPIHNSTVTLNGAVTWRVN